MIRNIFLIMFVGIKLLAGQEIGNGGGFALCSDKNYYSYDFLITQKEQFGSIRIGMTSNQHFEFIRAQLLRLKDPLIASFNEFMSSLFTQVPGKRFQWFSRTNLPLLWEPGLMPLLPVNCKTRKQAAYYFGTTTKTNQVNYSFDLALLRQVEGQPNGGLQVSFLIVHEWLWNYFPQEKFQKLAIFNRLLHSESLRTISKTDFERLKTQLIPTTRSKR